MKVFHFMRKQSALNHRTIECLFVTRFLSFSFPFSFLLSFVFHFHYHESCVHFVCDQEIVMQRLNKSLYLPLSIPLYPPLPPPPPPILKQSPLTEWITAFNSIILLIGLESTRHQTHSVFHGINFVLRKRKSHSSTSTSMDIMRNQRNQVSH